MNFKKALWILPLILYANLGKADNGSDVRQWGESLGDINYIGFKDASEEWKYFKHNCSPDILKILTGGTDKLELNDAVPGSVIQCTGGHELIKTNEGSFLKLITDKDNLFYYMKVECKSLLEGFEPTIISEGASAPTDAITPQCLDDDDRIKATIGYSGPTIFSGYPGEVKKLSINIEDTDTYEAVGECLIDQDEDEKSKWYLTIPTDRLVCTTTIRANFANEAAELKLKAHRLEDLNVVCANRKQECGSQTTSGTGCYLSDSQIALFDSIVSEYGLTPTNLSCVYLKENIGDIIKETKSLKLGTNALDNLLNNFQSSDSSASLAANDQLAQITELSILYPFLNSSEISPNIEKIQINGTNANDISVFDAVISKITALKLKYLDLSANAITNADSLSTFELLEVVNLAANKLSKIPNLSSNTQLRTLDLSYNSLNHDAQEDHDLTPIDGLKHLNLEGNPLSQDNLYFPLMQSQSLETLNLANMTISLNVLSAESIENEPKIINVMLTDLIGDSFNGLVQNKTPYRSLTSAFNKTDEQPAPENLCGEVTQEFCSFYDLTDSYTKYFGDN